MSPAGSGLRCSYTTTDTSAARSAGAETVEQPGADDLGDQQIALVERPGQHLAALGQLPRVDVDVAVRAQHVEHPVEVVTERAVLAGDTALDVADLACHPVGLAGGAQLGAEIRVVLHRVDVRRARRARRTRGGRCAAPPVA